MWEPLAILAEGYLTPEGAKTARGAIRYGPGQVVAVIDSTRAPADTGDHLGWGAGIPVVGTVAEAIARGARAILIGIAPRGGELPPSWRSFLVEALEAGLHVANGLHTQLAEDPQLREAAERGQAAVWELRRPPAEMPLARGERAAGTARVVLTIGSDCHVGKMTAALELHRAARARGRASAFVPTGQTGIFIARWGVSVDRVPGDFMSGVVEEMVRVAAERNDLVWVEGQGTLYHPAYSGVALGILHGALADALILCHVAGRERVRGFATRIPPLAEVVRRHEEVASWIRPARVTGIALVTGDVPAAEATRLVRAAEEETGLPVTDCLRFGVEKLLEAVEAGQ